MKGRLGDIQLALESTFNSELLAISRESSQVLVGPQIPFCSKNCKQFLAMVNEELFQIFIVHQKWQSERHYVQVKNIVSQFEPPSPLSRTGVKLSKFSQKRFVCILPIKRERLDEGCFIKGGNITHFHSSQTFLILSFPECLVCV